MKDRLVSVVLSVLTAVLAVSLVAFATTVGDSVTVTGALTVNGNSTLGDAVGDTITVNGRFAGFMSTASSTVDSAFTVSGNLSASSTASIFGLLVGNGGTAAFEDLGSLGADELAVEGAAEIDGIAYLDGGFIGTGSSTATSNFYAGGPVSASSSLAVSGLSTLGTGFLSQASSTVSAGTFNVGNGSGGSIGIASSTPSQELGVTGDAYISSTLGVATSTPGGTIGVNGGAVLESSSGTSTLVLSSSLSGRGGCIQLRATNGNMIRIYASTTPPAQLGSNVSLRGLVIEAGSCNDGS